MSNLPASSSTMSQDPTLSSTSSTNLVPKHYSQIIAYGSQEMVDSVVQAAKFAYEYDRNGTLWDLKLPTDPADTSMTEQQRKTNKLIRRFIDEGSAWIPEVDRRAYTRQVWQAADTGLPHGMSIHSIDTHLGTFQAINMFCPTPDFLENASTRLYNLDTGGFDDMIGYPTTFRLPQNDLIARYRHS